MEVFITGATGVLGKRLVDAFDGAGYTVYGLARDQPGEDIIEAYGGIPVRGDVLDRESLESAVPEVQTVIHAATSIPTARKPNPEAWTVNNRIRREGAKHLVEVAGGHLERFLFPSVVWVARQPNGEHFDETASPNPDIGAQGALDTEAYLNSAASRYGFDVTVLRCGLFYAHDGASTRQFAKSLLSGRLPIVGDGLLGRRDAPLSRVHPTDAAAAFVAAIEADISGVYHVVDDEPVGIGPYLQELSSLLDVSPPGHRIPRWLARFFIGKVSADLLGRPMPTSNERFKRETEWQPTYATYREGLEAVVQHWEEHGTIRREDGYEWNGEER